MIDILYAFLLLTYSVNLCISSACAYICVDYKGFIYTPIPCNQNIHFISKFECIEIILSPGQFNKYWSTGPFNKSYWASQVILVSIGSIGHKRNIWSWPGVLRSKYVGRPPGQFFGSPAHTLKPGFYPVFPVKTRVFSSVTR